MGLIVDAVMGVWERQKKIVASSRDNVMYVDLTAKEIAAWYRAGSYGSTQNSYDDGDFSSFSDNFDDVKDDVLLSADGVHPNKRMYAKWAELVGHKLYRYLIFQTESRKNGHERQKI